MGTATKTTKHTPGPWVWQSFDGGQSVFLGTPDRGRLVVMDFVRKGMNRAAPRFAFRRNGRDVGGVLDTVDLVTIDEHPDAKLIAAAPELLASCKALCRRLESNELVNRPDNPCNHYDQLVYDAALAAIAKAEGNQQ